MSHTEIIKSAILKAIPKNLKRVHAGWTGSGTWTTSEAGEFYVSASETGIGGKRVRIWHFSGAGTCAYSRGVTSPMVQSGVHIYFRVLDPAGAEIFSHAGILTLPIEVDNVEAIEVWVRMAFAREADATNPVRWVCRIDCILLYEVIG